MKNGKILVTGATGAVGPSVINALYQAGFRVSSFSLDAPTEGMFPLRTKVMIGDVTDKSAVRYALQDVDAVIHLAALLHIVDPTPELIEKYEKINVGGTETVVEAAIKERVKRVVLFSTIAVYGSSDGSVLDEDSPPRPETIYARTKLAAEQVVLNAKRADGRPLGTVLRLGAVYGSRIKGNYERLTRALARNRFVPIGKGLNRRTLVYDKDVGRAATLAVSHPEAAGWVFNVTDGCFHTLDEIIRSICNALGRKPPAFSLPLSPVRRVVGLLEDGVRMFGCRSPINRSLIDKYTEEITVDGTRIRRMLGFSPQYDLRTGWEETVKEMRRCGEL